MLGNCRRYDESLAILQGRAHGTPGFYMNPPLLSVTVPTVLVAQWLDVRQNVLGFPHSDGHDLRGGYDVQNADQARGSCSSRSLLRARRAASCCRSLKSWIQP